MGTMEKIEREQTQMKKMNLRVWLAAGLMGLAMMGSVTTVYAKENREDYRLVFDAQYYYDQNPDLQEAVGADPEALFEHFVTFGTKEGRSGNAEFNLKAYVFNNPDLLLKYKKDWSEYCKHYVTVGKAEGRLASVQESQGDVIGTWTTTYDESLVRTTNVKLAASRINGKILQPGELMSFSDTILSRTVANGYVSAPAIKRYEVGGGICQVSSTLHAAMALGMMPVIERYSHSEAVPYLPRGLDATISEGYLDLKFINPYDEPIQILASAENGALTVTIQYYDESKAQEETKANAAVEKAHTPQIVTAGQWIETNGRWWYDNGDGTYRQNGWFWIDGDRNGTAECYYFDQDGWMLSNCTTPDGYVVNKDGAWTKQGVVQTIK